MESYQQEWIAERRAYLRKKHYIQSRPNFIEAWIRQTNEYEQFLENPNVSLNFIQSFSMERQRKFISNPNVNLEFIKAYMNNSAGTADINEFIGCSRRGQIIIDEVMANLDIPWDCNGLCVNPWTSYADIEKYDCLQLWDILSKKKNISIAFIEKYENKPWNSFQLVNCIYPREPAEIDRYLSIKKIATETYDKDYGSLLCKSTLTKEFVEEICNDIRLWAPPLITNPTLPLDYCLKWATRCYHHIFMNPNTTEEFIIENEIFSKINNSNHIHGEFISKHISIEFLLKNAPKSWFRGLSRHPKITFEIVLEHAQEPWSWKHLAQHPNIYPDDIIRHCDLPWTEFLGRNKYLMPEHVDYVRDIEIRNHFIGSKSFTKFKQNYLLWDREPIYYENSIARDIKARQTRLQSAIDESFAIVIAIAVIKYIDYI
jgi:hypothetical protein